MLRNIGSHVLVDRRLRGRKLGFVLSFLDIIILSELLLTRGPITHGMSDYAAGCLIVTSAINFEHRVIVCLFWDII